MTMHPLQAELFGQLAEPFTGETLLDNLPDLVYFIKNAKGQYVVVNQTLVERCGRHQKSELMGKTADQVYPRPLGQSYRAQDDAILRTGAPILNRLELQIYASGETGWCLTNETPLRGHRGEVVGLVGISKDLFAPNESSEDYSPIAEAVQYIQSHFARPLTVRQDSPPGRAFPVISSKSGCGRSFRLPPDNSFRRCAWKRPCSGSGKRTKRSSKLPWNAATPTKALSHGNSDRRWACRRRTTGEYRVFDPIASHSEGLTRKMVSKRQIRVTPPASESGCRSGPAETGSRSSTPWSSRGRT